MFLKRLTFTMGMIFMMVLFFGGEVFAQDTPIESNPPTEAEEHIPLSKYPIKIGTLELTPSNSIVKLEKDGKRLYVNPTIRFKIKNASASDIKVILFKRSIDVTDNTGQSLFSGYNITSGGILMSDRERYDFGTTFDEDKSRFVILSPQQLFEVQLKNSDRWYMDDKDGDVSKTYRPASFCISAAIGIMNIDESTEIRAFSFTDVPIQVFVP